MNGELLQEKRIEHRYTQKQLAELVGLKPWSIAAYEAGRVEPSIISRYRISKVLDWPELLEGLTRGEKITILRHEKGLSQEDLAAACGVSRAAVNAWENNRSKPKNSMERKIAEVLGCSLTELC